MTRIVVAIDGLASSGKTTLARLLAQQLGYVHLNTGLLYRGVAFVALSHGVDVDSSEQLVAMLGKHTIQLRCAEGDNTSARLFVDNQDSTQSVLTPQVSEATSKAARHAEVRSALHPLQRDAFPGSNLVAEGRDMGTVVFPDAQVKFFIEADAAVRVERRIAQLALSSGVSLNELKRQMLQEITERDARDAERAVAPTKPAPDSVIIDNSTAPLEQILKQMGDVVRSKVGAASR